MVCGVVRLRCQSGVVLSLRFRVRSFKVEGEDICSL